MKENIMKENLTQKLTQAQINQAKAASNARIPSVIRNGSVNDAVNFATEDFYKAEVVLKRATKNYTVAFVDLPRSLQLFVQQQFFRVNGAGMMLDALGFQTVTEVLATIYKPMSDYMMVTMEEWNNAIEAGGEVQKMFEEIAAEEEAQANKPATMQ